MDDLTNPRWIKSSHSGDNGGECVELASLGGEGMAVRDSKRPYGPVLRVTAAEWDVFRAGVKNGVFGGVSV
ncbi:DUF397 domain-containing protein [Sphaerisporangium sp. NPDC088356]|uniref:DUF397 domain-containing protein n=1 Tax=Sphaerisporangium sp. NPDC088356 TaxID=3154871 RepID=UPI003438257D